MSRTRRIVIAAGLVAAAVFFLFLVLAVLAATGIFGEPESESGPSPATTATMTLGPTPTPEPTSTPTPTPEPVDSCSSGSGDEYLDYVAIALPVLWDNMTYLLELMEKAIATDFHLLGLDEWRRDFAESIDYVRDDYERVLSLTAPGFLEPVGARYRQAASAIQEAVAGFAEFVETRDEGTLASAFLAVEVATEAASDGLRIQEAICEFAP